MFNPWVRLLSVSLLTTLGLALLGESHPQFGVYARTPQTPPPGTVYLAGGLSPENVVLFSTAVQAADPEALMLLDTPRARASARTLVNALHPPEIIPVGTFSDGLTGVQKYLPFKRESALGWTEGPPDRLWRKLFPRAHTVVLCPAEPRSQMLQAACLAGQMRAPLYVLHGHAEEPKHLECQLKTWQTREIYLIGKTGYKPEQFAGKKVIPLPTESNVVESYIRLLSKGGPIETLVIANPADFQDGASSMASLAPWLALQKRAVLLCTEPDGYDVPELVLAAQTQRPLRRVENLILLGNLDRLPQECRPNPIPEDKDPHIEMEPLTPENTEPTTFCTGRLFHEEPAVITHMLARQRLLAQHTGPRKALVASNPGDSLPLLETFSRSTIKELRNCGYETRAILGKDVTRESLRRQLPEHDIFLWEGHHNTLIRDWEFPDWDEPLPNSLVFLQSCLALKEWKVQPLMTRGAVGVIGSSTRTYSASGGACSLAFFNSLLYDEQTLGGSLRQAKNFLLTYALFKEKRLGKDATRTGANLRAAWAFTLWGDPTLKLPAPERPKNALPPIRHEVKGKYLIVTLPAQRHDKVMSSKFQAEMPANARMAGLVRKEKDDDGQPLVPFVFLEVALPKAPEGMVPVLHSRLPERHWVFNWDARRRCGYLLAAPRTRDQGELRFRIDYKPVSDQITATPTDRHEVLP